MELLPLSWDCLHKRSDSGSLNCLRSLRFTECGSIISLQIHGKLGSPFTWGWRAGSSNRFGNLRLSEPESLGLKEKGLWNNSRGGFVRAAGVRLKGPLHANAVTDSWPPPECLTDPTTRGNCHPTTDKLHRGRNAGLTVSFILGSFLYKNVTGIYCPL